jgi:hypothetical protein
MIQLNGGELSIEGDHWTLYPFFDTSSTKHMCRTCNHIVSENKNACEWGNFPLNAVAIGDNGSGDYLLLLPCDDNSNQLSMKYTYGDMKKEVLIYCTKYHSTAQADLR